MPTKYDITTTAVGGVPPKAWKVAHRTEMSKPHQATAPSSDGLRLRTRLIAVRTPLAAAAGAAAAPLARRPSRPPCDHRATRRSKSPGSSETARKSAITAAPNMAGTIVIANGADPGKTPA